MCFFGGGSQEPPQASAPPAATAPPAVATPPSPTIPAGTPTISPTSSAPQTAEQRRKKIAAMRYGMMSTIKTSPRGLVGAEAELNIPSAAGTTKEKLGQ